MSTVRDTKEITICKEGIHPNATITIRCNCDEYEKTLSLADERRNFLLEVAWADVEKTFKEELRKGRR